MGLESASVDLLSEVFGFWDDMMDVNFWLFCGCCAVYVFGMISSSRMKFCMMCNLLLRFNKLQPAGCNRVSPACSVLPVQFSCILYV